MDHQLKKIQFISIKQSLYESAQIKYNLNIIFFKTLVTINRYTILE